MNATAAMIRLLDLLVAGSIAYERLATLRARLEAMQADGRDPTPEEWTALFDTIDEDSARLARMAE